MGLISLVVTLAVVGLILYAVNTYIPMDSKIKSILNVVVVIAVILWLLSTFGLLSVGNINVPSAGHYHRVTNTQMIV